jgi:class 3 adenylate cyclase
MRLLSIACLAIIAIFLFPLLPLKNLHVFKYITVTQNIERAISSFVQSIIPTSSIGIDIRWIVIIMAILLAMFFSWLREQYRGKITKITFKRKYAVLKEQMHLSDDAAVLTPIREKIERLHAANKNEREELLKLFAETKKKLKTMGRDLAFLSIDVVDSTGMKQGEDKESVEYDFREYKNFVEAKLKEQGVLKSTWTPDGVMSCFPTVDAAVRAAREVIVGLETFNKKVKTLTQDFRVRCGINSGYVYFDESIPLEEISDHVIDVAGHMQKQALPNTICIAKPAIEPMKEREGFSTAGRFVDGYEIYVWEKSNPSL